MKEIRAMSGRGLLALICSLLTVFQPVSAASNPPVIARANSGSIIAFISHGEPSDAPELIAVAKLTGTADRNGLPLINGSIVSSGDFLSTHGDSALLLTSTPQERLWFGPNTSARLTKDAGNVAITLQRGTLGFETRGHIRVTFENHDDLALRSRPDSPALAQLSFVNSQEARVRLQEGSLELVQGSHSVVLQPERSRSISASGIHLAGEPPSKANSGTQAAQSKPSTGTIKGTVVDANLVAVSGATVTLTNAAGRPFTTVSQDGYFSFTDLPAGIYTLRVARTGSQPFELRNVVVRPGNESSLFVQLKGGGGAGTGNNHLLLWVVIGGAAAGGVGAYLGTRGGSSSTSPSTPQ